jgi:hypothetical protein
MKKYIIISVAYIFSVILIVFILKYYNFFNKNIVGVPIIPGNVSNTSLPTTNSKGILINIQNMLNFLNDKKNETL